MYRVGMIGCGRPRATEGATGFGMSHAHAYRPAHPRSVQLANAENPPGGGFSADKTDSLVWREVISRFGMRRNGCYVFVGFRHICEHSNTKRRQLCLSIC